MFAYVFDALALLLVALGLCGLYTLIAERQNRRRERYVARLAAQEPDDTPGDMHGAGGELSRRPRGEHMEPQEASLVVCSYCGKESRTINGIYIVACDCKR